SAALWTASFAASPAFSAASFVASAAFFASSEIASPVSFALSAAFFAVSLTALAAFSASACASSAALSTARPAFSPAPLLQATPRLAARAALQTRAARIRLVFIPLLLSFLLQHAGHERHEVLSRERNFHRHGQLRVASLL